MEVNMEILLLIIGLLIGYIIGDKFSLKHNKPEVKKLTEEEVRDREKYEKHFNGLMNYDSKQAYGGKR